MVSNNIFIMLLYFYDYKQILINIQFCKIVKLYFFKLSIEIQINYINDYIICFCYEYL